MLNVDWVLRRIHNRGLEVQVGLRKNWWILYHLFMLETHMLVVNAPIFIEHFLLKRSINVFVISAAPFWINFNLLQSEMVWSWDYHRS